MRDAENLTISIHALLAESDSAPRFTPAASRNFYPRSPCGERPCIMTTTICTASFLSTLSLRRATSSIDDLEPSKTHFYPRSPCGERRVPETLVPRHYQFLSTLSLRRATRFWMKCQERQGISIHALLAESDSRQRAGSTACTRFLSTLSLRRATCWARSRRQPSSDFYPRSPCGERPADIASFAGLCNFYPRSPCGERHVTRPSG